MIPAGSREISLYRARIMLRLSVPFLFVVAAQLGLWTLHAFHLWAHAEKVSHVVSGVTAGLILFQVGFFFGAAAPVPSTTQDGVTADDH